MAITVGLKAERVEQVTPEQTAEVVGSGSLPVFATPCLVRLMEQTACECIAPALQEGETTVGTKVDIRHVKATPCGMGLRCCCELVEVEGRRLVFSLQAHDDQGLIGEGLHERVLVSAEKFMKKVQGN